MINYNLLFIIFFTLFNYVCIITLVFLFNILYHKKNYYFENEDNIYKLKIDLNEWIVYANHYFNKLSFISFIFLVIMFFSLGINNYYLFISMSSLILWDFLSLNARRTYIYTASGFLVKNLFNGLSTVTMPSFIQWDFVEKIIISEKDEFIIFVLKDEIEITTGYNTIYHFVPRCNQLNLIQWFDNNAIEYSIEDNQEEIQQILNSIKGLAL